MLKSKAELVALFKDIQCRETMNEFLDKHCTWVLPSDIDSKTGINGEFYGFFYVYFLFKEGKCVYVGQSQQLVQRLCSHKSSKKFDIAGFFSAWDFEVYGVDPPHVIDFIEAFFINILHPMTFNKFSPLGNHKMFPKDGATSLYRPVINSWFEEQQKK